MHTVGIDVGKNKHVAYALDAEGKSVGKALHFDNNREGFEQLTAYLDSLSEPAIGLEATGHYWLALYSLLTENDYTVFVLNPLQIHAFRRSGIRKRKNDRYDALWIADNIRISRDL